ncbi:hypothetical protein METEAL_05890 [Mesoterricola silvestris]|uniref:Uncharacterized protein n=2 Tax=Mesoterricola silvestris TaxID=2927979 RepID=A0AA48GNS9_9BACT|nr:hypothetical protein METEAL_05890 [Mesoterricola silvestris]
MDFPGFPKPKVSERYVWISNGKKINKKPIISMQGNAKIPGTVITFPPEIESFSEFEVIDEDAIFLWGINWQKKDGNQYIYDASIKTFSALFNPTSNKLVKVIKELESKDVPDFYEAIKRLKVIALKNKQFFIFAEIYTGRTLIYDTDRKTIKTVELLRNEELRTGSEAVNNGPAIGWISPVGDEELLISCRVYLPGKEGSKAKGTWIDTFKTFDLSSNSLSQDLMNYRGFIPNLERPLIGFRGGVASLEDVIALAR